MLSKAPFLFPVIYISDSSDIGVANESRCLVTLYYKPRIVVPDVSQALMVQSKREGERSHERAIQVLISSANSHPKDIAC